MTKLVEDRDIVVPGEALYDGNDLDPGNGTFRSDSKIMSKYTGTVQFRDEVRVTPMNGKYLPQKGDSVIGEISRISHSNWTVDLNSPYDAILPIGEAVDDYVDLAKDDIAKWFDLGDAIVAKIQKVTKGKDVQLTMDDRRARKLKGGRVVTVPPAKVPRLIGRKGTMVNTIKGKTDCTVVVGQNGRVWISGEKENLAAKAVRKVAREAHVSGLTDKVAAWLDEQNGGGN